MTLISLPRIHGFHGWKSKMLQPLVDAVAPRVCPTCDEGTGTVLEAGTPKRCPTCGGTGRPC